MTVNTVELPRTASHPKRTATFVAQSTANNNVRGVLEIREESADGKVAVSRYRLRGTVMIGPQKRVCFLFMLHPPGLRGVFYLPQYVAINQDELDECSCDRFAAQGVCKHTQAVRLAVMPRVTFAV